jgi:hypothetical protein
MKKAVSIVVGCLLCFSLAGGDARNFSDLLQGGVSLRHAVIPLYTRGSARLSTVVRVGRAYLDYQRRGFFRIGMFPVVILDGVTIEAHDTNNPMASLADVQQWLAAKGGQRVEMRGVKFVFSAASFVEAGLAQCRSEDHWDLLEGVHFVSGGGEGRAPRGTLVLTGARAGQVILDTSPRQTRIFLASAVALPAPSNSLAIQSNQSK